MTVHALCILLIQRWPSHQEILWAEAPRFGARRHIKVAPQHRIGALICIAMQSGDRGSRVLSTKHVIAQGSC